MGAQILIGADPDPPVMLVEPKVALSPGEMDVTASVTVPLNPPWPVTVITAKLHWVCTTLIGPLLLIVKSWTLTVTWLAALVTPRLSVAVTEATKEPGAE